MHARPWLPLPRFQRWLIDFIKDSDIANCRIKPKGSNAMSSNEGQQKAAAEPAEKDSANNEVGPTEKLREPSDSETELSVPGAQNPQSEEIKDEQNPNTE
jgi:hypothetical protein